MHCLCIKQKHYYTMEITKEFINTSELFKDNPNVNKNDCAVRAFAICMDCSYNEAETYMTENLNRLPGKGIEIINLMWHLRHNSKELFNVYKDQKVPTYNQFKKATMDNNKTYYILVKGHALAVKKGVIYGNGQDYKISRKRLWAVYEF